MYDTVKSQYITVEDSTTGQDITNPTLLQIIVDMETGPTQFLSAEVLRQLLILANHPLSKTYKIDLIQICPTPKF